MNADGPLMTPGAGPARPLDGVRVVVTRPREQSTSFVEMLEEAGAAVVLAPMIRVVPARDPAPMADAAVDLDRYDWIVLTSANGVLHLRAAVVKAGSEAAWARASICAIGPATAEAVENQGGRVALVASVHTAEGVAQAVGDATDLRGKRILLAQAAGARDVLHQTLSRLGAVVTQVEAYRTVPDVEGESGRQSRGTIRDGDVVTFTSASCVRAFLPSAGALPEGLKIASIGPITSREVREAGLEVDVEADPHTIEGLMAAILRIFAGAGG